MTWFAENVVCEPFVAAMKALFPGSVHEVIDSGRFTAEQRKRAYFAVDPNQRKSEVRGFVFFVVHGSSPGC